MRALQDYMRMGVVRSLGPGSTTSAGGKKPELFCFADERRILCINLWPGNITLALSGLIGDVYAMDSTPCPAGISLEESFALLRRLTAEYLEKQGLTLGDLYGVVVRAGYHCATLLAGIVGEGSGRVCVSWLTPSEDIDAFIAAATEISRSLKK